MSSNIRINRICKYCNNEFTARTTVTQYCSDKCAKYAYKLRQKNQKIKVSNVQTKIIRKKLIENLKAKMFLTVKDVSFILNCSSKTTYRLIKHQDIKAANILKRKTLIHRIELEKFLINKNNIHDL
jgi:excisionase family DNA binding protein